MRTWKRAGVLVAAVSLAAIAGPVLSASSDATPEYQSHAWGVSSRWTLYWGGDPPFNVSFFYGDAHNAIS